MQAQDQSQEITRYVRIILKQTGSGLRRAKFDVGQSLYGCDRVVVTITWNCWSWSENVTRCYGHNSPPLNGSLVQTIIT